MKAIFSRPKVEAGGSARATRLWRWAGTSSRRHLLTGMTFLLLCGWPPAGCAAASVTGQLVDYRTNEPIAGATVTVVRRGWGLSSGQLVWDRDYTASTQTGTQGEFSIRLPGPALLTGFGAGTLRVEAEGYQRLTEVAVRAGQRLRLQTLPRLTETVPGGMAAVGFYADGTPFGWSFVDNRPTTEAAYADIFPHGIRRSPVGLTLAAHAQGGIRFASQAAQGIDTPSHGHLLRYLGEAPADGYGATVALAEAGTVFVRTRDERYAKLAFDPQQMVTGSGNLVGAAQPVDFALLLPFAYNPLPGRGLPYDPSAPGRAVDPLYAAVAADVPPDGVVPRIARSYRLEVRDERGQVIDRLLVRLEPGVPRRLAGCLREGHPVYRYDNVMLAYGHDGLPRLRLSLLGKQFSFHTEEILVGRRRTSVVPFHDFDQPRPRQHELRLQEAAESVEDEPAG